MKELNVKTQNFNDRLQRVQDQQKVLVAGLDNFDNKKEEHEKHMRTLKLAKKNEEPRIDPYKLDKKEYH